MTQPVHISEVLKKDDFYRGKRLINDHMNNRISKDDFYKEITYFALICGFDELRKRPLPTFPKEMDEYENLAPEQRKNISPKFWQQDIIKSYVNQRHSVVCVNFATQEWLKLLAKRLKHYGDTPNLKKVENRLREFSPS